MKHRGTTAGGELRARVDALLDELVDSFYEQVPYGTHLSRARQIDLDYYRRHTIETVLRIRLKRTVDALAIRYFTLHDPATAKKWAEYTAEEMLHDAFFVKHLEKLGVAREAVYATPPLLATRLMMGYLLYGVEYEGSPLALIASVYFVEYVTVKTQPEWIGNLEARLGADKLRGARAHVDLDLADRHADFVWEVLHRLVEQSGGEARLFEHLRNIYRLWELYFTELHQVSVAARATAAS
jgi:hypothetical protein